LTGRNTIHSSNLMHLSYISRKVIMIILIMIVLGLTIIYIYDLGYVAGDIDTSKPHNQNLFYLSDTTYVCKVCHMGYPSQMASEVNGLFEEYRCVSCHINIASTTTLVEAHKESPHGAVGCTKCHDTVHFGHKKYETNTKGFYGCRGKHQVVNDDINPPTNPTVNFLDTYVVNNYTGPYSFQINKIKWFYSQSYDRTKTIYPYNFVDPYTGQPTDIPPSKRYWICLKCHFTKVGTQTTQTDQYWAVHQDECYSCHKYTGGYPSSIYNLAPHAIKTGIDTVFYNCKTCHSGINSTLSVSIHNNIGCSCHSTIHISKYNGTASWIYLFKSSPGLYETPRTINLTQWLIYYHYDITNTTTYNVSIYPILVGTDKRYVDQYYILRDGDATPISNKGLRFLTCFNCHFINEPGTVTPLTAENENLIPLPPNTLIDINDPHSISGIENQGGFSILENDILKLAFAGIAVILAVMTLTFITIVRFKGGGK